MSKPTVRFSELHSCKVGHSAVVMPIDHPSPLVSNTKYVVTSPVISCEKSDDGVVKAFETWNTKYELAQDVGESGK